MDHDGLPLATQPLALLDNRSTKQVVELLQTVSQSLAINDTRLWLPQNHPDNQHIASLLVTLSDSILKLFPRPGRDVWELEWRELCVLSLDIQERALAKVAILYDEKKTRPPAGAERTERAWLAMLFSVLGLANAWQLDEGSQRADPEGFTIIARRCVDVMAAMLRFLGSGLMLGDDPARPAWEVLRPCLDELVKFVTDVVDRLPTAVFPLELSLFTTPRIYETNSAPEPPALVSFPVTSAQGLLTAAVSAIAILVPTLSSPLSSDVFLKNYRQSTALAICDIFVQLELQPEPKLLGRLLGLALAWLDARPSDSIGITTHIWRIVIRRIHAGPSPDELSWNSVDDELAKLVKHIKLETTGLGWPDLEAVVMFCASNDTMSNLRSALCQLLTTQVNLLPREALQAFQDVPVDVDDSAQVLLDLRRAVDTRLQSSDAQSRAKPGKRKRDDEPDQQTDTNGDVVMKDASQITQPRLTRKRTSLEHISSTVFNQRQDWIPGGLGPENESDERFQGRVMDALLAELDSNRPPSTGAWAAIPCCLAHPAAMGQRCPIVRTGVAKTVSTYVDLCARFNEMQPVAAYDGLASALKHLDPEHATSALGALAVEKILVLLTNGLERPERAVRLAAGRAMTQFVEVRQRMPGDLEALTARPLAILSKLVSEGKNSVKETALSILGDIGKIASEYVLGRIILVHITLLQQQNLVIKGLAYAQILELASFLNKAAFQLLSPYFKQITPLIVEKITTSPGILFDVCQLLTVTPRDFLTYTRAPALSAAIKSCNRAIIDNLAAHVEQNPGALLLENAQEYLPEILLMDDENAVRKAMAFLCRDVLNEIIQRRTRKADGMTEARLLGSCGAPLIGELVMQLGSEDKDRQDRARWAIGYVAQQLTLERGERATPAVDLPAFLTNHMLGIVIHINDALQDVRGKTSVAQKNQVIRSLGVVIELVGTSCSFVSPQIMATLQSMLCIASLAEATLSTWFSFIQTLSLLDAGPLLGVTTAAIARNWKDLSEKAKEWATKILEYLLVENGRDIRQHLDTAVSFAQFPELRNFSKAIKRLRGQSTDALENLLVRASNENVNIAIRSLDELRAHLLSHRGTVEGYMVGDVFNPWLARAMKVLFVAACREGDGSDELHELAYECISIIGALDPDRLDLQSGHQDLMVMHNFEDEDEAVWFTIYLISDVLVSAFRSTTDLKYQRHLAYAIQELLKQCGFTTALMKGSAHSIPTKVRNRWRMLSQDVVETVGPLLEGRFTIQSKPPVVPNFPIYSHSSTYREWVQTWTAYLISCVQNPRASRIFEVFRPPIRNQDVRVAKQILPHLIITISQSEGDLDHITQEIVAVLKDQIDSVDGTSNPRKALSAQMVFDLMDQLNRWIRNKNQETVRKRAELRRSRYQLKDVGSHPAVAALEFQRAKVESLLSMIDNELLSNAAFRCRAFARSLMSFEKEIVAKREQKKTEQELQPLYERLHEIYANLDEPDGMEGTSKLVISPSLDQQIRGHEMTGRWTSAQSCWEIKLQHEPNSLEPHLGLLRCLRNLGHNDAMKTHIHGVLSNHPAWEPQLVDFSVEGAWKLGDLNAVKRLVSDPQRQSPEMTLGRLLLSAREDGEQEFKLVLKNARDVLGNTITSNGPTSYRRSYEAVLHLHMAREIESIYSAASFIGAASAHPKEEYMRVARRTLGNLTESLDNRFKSILPTFRVQEPVLSMRRTAYNLFSDEVNVVRREVGQAWLASSKIAIKASHFQTAYSSILQAQQNGMPFSFVQGCKLTRALGEPLRALQELAHSVRNVPPLSDTVEDGKPNPELRSMAKALLLRARWMHEADRYEDNVVIQEFLEAANTAKNWENPYFRLGQYYDERFKQMDTRTQTSRGPAINHFTCKYYVEAMKHGSKYIYQTMPRLLTIWLDMAQTDFLATGEREKQFRLPSGTESLYKAYKAITPVISDAYNSLQAFQWFTALPQLLSRVTHPNPAAYKYLHKIIVSVVTNYPQQALWGVSPLGQSRNYDRAARGRDILERAQNSGPEVKELVLQSRAMVKELLAMSEREVPDNEFALGMQKHFPGLARLAPSKLIMPLQEYLTVNLPPASTNLVHQPFPLNIPKFIKFNEEVEIMRSLQKPRKISAVAEDGRTYIFLAKPKDDLRKDARLMDLNSMINKLLKKNAESRRRQLHIRTYAVVILNEECGFLEWVPNTMGYRNVIVGLYEQRGMSIHSKPVMDWVQFKSKTMSDKEVYDYWVNKAIPSVLINLHEYFVSYFSEPTAWLSSRLAYTRTTAVMSMVGHILGLGDRHGENLLFDTSNGDLVHVDLNCLFERGATFEIPETVPFRLTANMVDGFGVTGVEGAFRTACEVTMGLLRDNYGSLISVLDAFVHDPLVEWEDQKRKNERVARQSRQRAGKTPDPRGLAGTSSAGSTDIKELARNAMLPIGRKLQGLSRDGRVMTVSNQVEALIREATDPVRLARMYVGWMSWI